MKTKAEEMGEKLSKYSSTIIIGCLSLTLIIVGISYNSLMNDNGNLRSEIFDLELYICEEEIELEGLVKRISKLEEAVFKSNKR